MWLRNYSLTHSGCPGKEAVKWVSLLCLCVCACMCVYVSTLMCLCVYVSVCVCVYVDVSVCVCVYVDVSVCVCVCVQWWACSAWHSESVWDGLSVQVAVSSYRPDQPLFFQQLGKSADWRWDWRRCQSHLQVTTAFTWSSLTCRVWIVQK